MAGQKKGLTLIIELVSMKKGQYIAMANLTVVEGGLDWRSFEIDKHTITIGKHGDFKTPRFADTVSRIHCAVMLTGDSYQVRDLNSYNGTSVNGKLIGSKTKTLRGGDKITVGNVTLVFSR